MIDPGFTKEFLDSIEGAHSTEVKQSGKYWYVDILDKDGNVLYRKSSLGEEYQFIYCTATNTWSEYNVGKPSADEIAADEIAADEACRGREREPSMEQRMTRVELTLDTILALLQDK